MKKYKELKIAAMCALAMIIVVAAVLIQEQTVTTGNDTPENIIVAEEQTETAESDTSESTTAAEEQTETTESDTSESTTAAEEQTEATESGTSESTTAAEKQTEKVVDTTPPVVSGVKEITVHAGDAVSYKSGVTVTDDTDPDPQLTIDNSKVDLSEVGTYEVYYIATDSSGNKTTVTSYVNVTARETITAEAAGAVADEILAGIITDGMSDKEKLRAVYNYIHSIGYIDVDYAGVDDYLTNSYYFLTTKRGDCKCFYAASKLLLERLGFTTTRIQNRSGVMVHYWNLVSTDGGATWYHFDPTDWEWTDSEQPFMMTDEEILAYSARHDNIPYDWDTGSYPATPTESYKD